MAAVLGILWAASSQAAWEFVPELSLEAETNDNPRLLPEGAEVGLLSPDPASRLLLEARAYITSYGARGEFYLEPAVRTDAYAESENDDLQSTDVFLRTGTEFRWQRARAGFDADLAGERIIGSEYLSVDELDPGLEDVTVTDTVLLAENERRNRVMLLPYLEFDPNINGTVRLESRLMDVRYDSDAITRRTDFVDLQASAMYTHRLGDRTTISGRFYLERFEADDNQNTTNSAGLEAQYSRAISGIWFLDFALGGVRSEPDYLDTFGPVTQPTRVVGTYDDATFSIGVRRRAELSRFTLDIGRDLSPDSFGYLVARNQLRFLLTQTFSATVDGRISLRAIQTESTTSEQREDRNYGRLDLSVGWAFAELWSLTASYAYSSRDVVSSVFDSGDATSNSVSIGVSYRGRERPR